MALPLHCLFRIHNIKAIAAVLFFLSLTTSLYADTKWIPIEPINTNETSISDANRSKQPVNKWIENVRVIQRLLDTTRKDGVETEDKKNWYSLENGEDK